MGAPMNPDSVDTDARRSRGRAKYVAPPPPANDVAGQMAVTLTREQLSALVSAAVTEALSAHSTGPLLVDKQAMAQKLGCSAAHIDQLRKQGLPTILVGQAVRFEPSRVLEWLRAQQTDAVIE